MNKKEQAYVEKLENDLRIAKAFRFTSPIAPDVPPPANYADDLTKGFLFNAYFSSMNGDTVSLACSSSIHHNAHNNDKTTTQGSKSLYSTKLLALKALRAEAEIQCAKRLANIDQQIEQASTESQEPPK